MSSAKWRPFCLGLNVLEPYGDVDRQGILEAITHNYGVSRVSADSPALRDAGASAGTVITNFKSHAYMRVII